VAPLALVGSFAFSAAAADVEQKGKRLRIQFRNQTPETIDVTGCVDDFHDSETPQTSCFRDSPCPDDLCDKDRSDVELPGNIALVVDGGAVQEFARVSNISVTGSPLDDNLCMAETVNIVGGLKVKAGDGDDAIYVSGTYGKSVKINLGDGDDDHWECESFLIVGGNYTVKAGKGDDELHWEQDIDVDKSMKLRLGKGDVNGNDDVILHSNVYNIRRALTVKLSKEGGQRLELENVSANKLVVRGGKGTDELDLIGGNLFNEIRTKNVEIGAP
jgi:hypothetical protein